MKPIKYRRISLFVAGMCAECALFSFVGGHYIFAVLQSVICIVLLLPELMSRKAVINTTIRIDSMAGGEHMRKEVLDAIARSCQPRRG